METQARWGVIELRIHRKLVMKRRKQQSAFTLVEAIVAVAIFSMVLTMVYGVFFSMLRSTEAGAEAAIKVQRNRIALKTLEDAFSGLVYYDQNKDIYAFIADTLDYDYPSVSFVSRVPPDFLGNNEFGSQALRRITFKVEDDEDFGRSLVMYQSSTLQPVDALEVEEPSRWVLGQDLDTFLMLFYSTINNEWIYEWEETNSIPKRIKFELAYTRSDGGAAQIEDMHKREFALFSQSITQAMQNPKLATSTKSRSKSSKGGSSRGSSSKSSSSKSSSRYTPEQIAAWRKRQEAARKGRGDSKRDSSSGGRKISDLPKGMQDIAKKYDANRDGKIDGQEWAKLGPALRNMSSNGSNGSSNSGNNSGSSGSNSGGTDTNEGTSGGSGGLTGNPSQLMIQAAVIKYQIENENLPDNLQELVNGGYVKDSDGVVLTTLPLPPVGEEWVLNEDGTVTSAAFK